MFRHLFTIPLALFLSLALWTVGPTAQQAPKLPTVTFEVASIKPNDGSSPREQLNVQPGGRLIVVNRPLRALITFAYRIQAYQIVGAPDWVNEKRWDVTAQLPADVPMAPPPGGGVGPVPLAVRTMLADRFKLTVREEIREQDIYALTMGAGRKPGPSLKPVAPPCTPEALAALKDAAPEQRRGVFCGIRTLGPGRIVVTGQPLSELATHLSNIVGRFVLDRTGVDTRWDFTLDFAPDVAAAGPSPDTNLPGLFTAIQEQLGLKLEPAKAPVPVLVVGRVEMPTPD